MKVNLARRTMELYYPGIPVAIKFTEGRHSCNLYRTINSWENRLVYDAYGRGYYIHLSEDGFQEIELCDEENSWEL